VLTKRVLLRGELRIVNKRGRSVGYSMVFTFG
jgi:hypothetical protein